MLLTDLVSPVTIDALDTDASLSPSRSYVQQYEPDDPKTHAGRNLERMSMRQLYEAFGLQETTIDFVVRCPLRGLPSALSSTAFHVSALRVDRGKRGRTADPLLQCLSC